MSNSVYVITNKKNDLNGIITNVDENNVEIVWEDETSLQLSNEDFASLLEKTDEYEVTQTEVNEETTPAAASIATHKSADASNGDADGNPKTRLDWIRRIVGNLANVDSATLVKIFNDQQALIGGEAERAGVAGNSGKNAASIAMKPSGAVSSKPVAESIIKLQKEEMDALFGETELTEEFKTKVSTLFETAVVVRLSEEVVKIQEAYDLKLAESVDNLTSELIENIDSYLDHVVKEWAEVNEVAIESSLRTELTMEFLDGLKSLFQEHYIDLPEDKVPVFEKLVEENEATEKKLNDALNESIEKDKMIKSLQKDAVIAEASYGLTLVQKDKLKTLLEGADFDGDEAFKTKVNTIKEGFITPTKTGKSNILNEGIDPVEGETQKEIKEDSIDDPMMKVIADTLKRNSTFSSVKN